MGRRSRYLPEVSSSAISPWRSPFRYGCDLKHFSIGVERLTSEKGLVGAVVTFLHTRTARALKYRRAILVGTP